MKRAIIEGQYTLAPESQQWAMPGWSGRYWDVITYDDEEDLAAYLAGQQPFIREEKPRFPSIVYGQEARQQDRRQPEHVCARCGRTCKPQYKHCYRCNQYLKVKASIA